MTTSSGKPLKTKSIVVISGPTGSGKTDLSIAIAKHFGTPILSADSRQIFKGMPIGTAQPTPSQLAEIDHYLIASHPITEHYTAGRYEKEALAILANLFESKDFVVVVGGSTMYVDALCHGMDRLPETDHKLRATLTKRLEESGLGDLLSELQRLDPVFYKQVDRDNPMRVMRALEVTLQTGVPYSTLRTKNRAVRNFNIIKIGTELPREVLYDRINRRVEAMISDGLEQEARELYPHRELNSLQTVGYRELFDYFDGKTTLEIAIELIKRNSRRYAKRQMTWLRSDSEIVWFRPLDVEKVIEYLSARLA